ncbi:MAG TPA: sensor domain-containing diguanylate cyclase, partial [Candidatus Polarisedimenticolia bacterium]|nr:sensor domain-containing diguanylate cyclase [Candidatus Polarisedimenticolia bacterium]
EALLLRSEERLAAARAAARARARRLSVLSDIAQAANSVLEPRKVMEIVMQRAQELIRTEAWALLLLDEKDNMLSFEMAMGGKLAAMKDTRVRLGEGIAGWVAQHKKPLVVNDVLRDRRFDPRLDRRTGFTTRSVLCAPLVSRGRIIGAVELINKKRGRFHAEDLEMLTTLAEPGAIAIENAILYQRSAELTVTDDLTKLFNSRYLNVHLQREIKRSRRYGMPVSLIFLDLDGFKLVNDQYGHLAGSRALFEVGRVLQQTVREIDVVSRYGGDEFTIILPQTGAQGALVIADRIRGCLEEQVFLAALGLRVRLTASFGVSTFPDHGQSREDLIQKADQAMYLVKDRGKNGVALALQATVSEKGRI